MVSSDGSERTETVIIGSGIVGTSIAYQLSQMGHTDVLVLDRGALPVESGTSAVAPTPVIQTASSPTLAKSAAATRELAEHFDAYEACGSIEVALDASGRHDLDSRLDSARAYDIDGASRLDPSAVASVFPGVDPEAIAGGYHVPSDGWIHTHDYLKGAQQAAESAGIEFAAHTAVTDLETVGGQITAVETDAGRVEAERVIIAANTGAPELCELAGYELPIGHYAHPYGVTESVASIDEVTPWMLIPESAVYLRGDGDAIGIGTYRNEPTPATEATDTTPIYDHRPAADTSDDARSVEAIDAALKAVGDRIPDAQTAEVDRALSAPIGLAPDGNAIVGHVPGFDGLWVATGVQAMHAGGVATIIAEQLLEGSASISPNPWVVGRLQPHSAGERFLDAETKSAYRRANGRPRLAGPEAEGKTFRESPFYRYQAELDAQFYDLRYGGWNRAMAYGQNESLEAEFEIPERAGREDGWSAVSAYEHLAARQRVGMCDLTSFTTFSIVGHDAEAFAQEVFSNDMAIPVGSLTYSLMLDDQAGILGDMTVYRRSTDRYHVVSNSGGAGTNQIARLQRRARGRDGVFIEDQVSSRCGISVAGPNAREMLDPIVEADLDNESFPYFSAQETYVGDVPVDAFRVSYIGDLGWEFHTTMEYGAALWDTLWEAGQDHGVLAFGDGALVSLRLEKGFPAYGMDIYPEYTPAEASMMHTVDMDTDFVGREALATQLDDEGYRRRCILTVDDPAAVVGWNTAVMDGDDRIGFVTTTGEAYHIDEFVLNAYLDPAYTDPGTTVGVSYRGELVDATVRESPLWDPDGERVRS